ncbi:Ulp1 protease family [Abeliophyllum distichum]|uniref:Ulp1 protease family n=1 Tax=Abeliophyllum distichum TaxID=126358 RepID=A0ABD1QYR9_9LAMI
MFDPKGKLVQRSAAVDYHVYMQGYASGSIPRNFGRRWKQCDHILWPYMIDNKYWVLFHVDLQVWKLTIFDNNQRFYDEAMIYPHILSCINIIPEMIQKYVSSDSVDLGKKKLEPLQYFKKSAIDIPQLRRFR